jgi:hypothetical protein
MSKKPHQHTLWHQGGMEGKQVKILARESQLETMMEGEDPATHP